MFKTFNLLTDTFLYTYYTFNITCTSNTLATSLRPEKSKQHVIYYLLFILFLYYFIPYNTCLVFPMYSEHTSSSLLLLLLIYFSWIWF